MTSHNQSAIDDIIRKIYKDFDAQDFETQKEMDEFITTLQSSFKYLMDDLKKIEL